MSVMICLLILSFLIIFLINSYQIAYAYIDYSSSCYSCTNIVGIAVHQKYVPSSFVNYDFPFFGLSISIPSDWRENKVPEFINEIATYYSPLINTADSYHDNLVIAGGMYNATISTDQLLNISIKSLAKLDKFLVMGIDKGINLSGHPGYRFQYSFEDNKKAYWAVQTGFISNSTFITVTYRAQIGQYAEFLPSVEKIIDSIKFKPLTQTELVQNVTYLTSKNSANNLTLKYPSNWIKTKEGFLSSLLTIYAPLDDISDRYYDNIRIKISNVTLQNITSLSQFIKERDNSLISLDGYKVILNGNTTLSGNPGLRNWYSPSVIVMVRKVTRLKELPP